AAADALGELRGGVGIGARGIGQEPNGQIVPATLGGAPRPVLVVAAAIPQDAHAHVDPGALRITPGLVAIVAGVVHEAPEAQPVARALREVAGGVSVVPRMVGQQPDAARGHGPDPHREPLAEALGVLRLPEIAGPAGQDIDVVAALVEEHAGPPRRAEGLGEGPRAVTVVT